jgi:signal transduction histidine kinase
MDNLEIFVLITTLVFLLLASALILFIFVYIKRQQENHKILNEIRNKSEADLLQATITTQEKERERIGANLHDDIGPLLSSFKMYFKHELNTKGENEEIKSILSALDVNIEQIRDFSRDLVPNVLHQFGLKASLEEFKRRFEKSSDVSILIFAEIQLEPTLEESLSLYRIIQESINNAIRHGGATQITINININKEELSLLIRDNGSGFNQQNKVIGLGLRNIEARSKAIGAQMEIVSQIDNGTQIKIMRSKSYKND